jgi:hypothetical protein
MWEHQIGHDTGLLTYQSSGRPKPEHPGWLERLENLIWARDHCDGLFRVVRVKARDTTATAPEIAHCFPDDELTMGITYLDDKTGEFHAVSVAPTHAMITPRAAASASLKCRSRRNSAIRPVLPDQRVLERSDMYLVVRGTDDVDRYMDQLRASARRVRDWIVTQSGDPLDLLRRMKFDPIGCHPIEDRPLNLVEQINQTWTFAAALAAARRLLDLHPDVSGFRLAPGAHASLPLDIMSEMEGQVGAETFAAVSPHNNGKLAMDLEKMAGRAEQHRYVFFMSPQYPKPERLSEFERDGVQVWSVAV